MDKQDIVGIVAYVMGLLTGGSLVGMSIGEGPFWDGLRDGWLFGLSKWLRKRLGMQ